MSDPDSEVVTNAIAAAHAATFKALTRYERVPFRKVLAGLLDCAPTPEAIRAFAEKSPDRWAQAVSIMAGLAGFDRGINPTINVYNVEGMSDAQLMARMAELERLARQAAALPGEAARVAADDSLPNLGTVAPELGRDSAAASGGPAWPGGPPPTPAIPAAAEITEEPAKP